MDFSNEGRALQFLNPSEQQANESNQEVPHLLQGHRIAAIKWILFDWRYLDSNPLSNYIHPIHCYLPPQELGTNYP